MKKILLILFSLGLFSSQSLAQCDASFSYSIDTSTYTVSLYDSAVKKGQSNVWLLDNRWVASGSNPTIRLQPGTYTICHVVSDSSRCVDSSCVSITIGSNTVSCQANFTYQVSSNGSVQFTTWSQGNQFNWTFGNSGTSTARNPKFQFKSNGKYSVCLTVSDTVRNCSDTVCKVIDVKTVSSGCNAGFQGYIDPNGKLRVWVSDTTLSNYSWNLGDGNSSSAIFPNHTYSKPGNYTVCLYVYDSTKNCSDSACSVLTYRSNTPGCRASFTHQKDTVNGVQFTFTGSGTSFSWDFGDGSSSTKKNPYHKYSKTGTYRVLLIVQDSSSNCTDSVTQTIQIGQSGNCRAKFEIKLDTTTKYKLKLVNKSSNHSANKYYWTFGDGGTSTKRNPSHTYQSFGRYQVCLLVTNANCFSRYCDSIGMDSTGKMLKNGAFELEVVEESLGVNEPSQDHVQVYPNPFTSVLTLKLNNGLDNRVEVYDINGTLISQTKTSKEEIEIQSSSWLPGLYYVRVVSERSSQTIKVLKMK